MPKTPDNKIKIEKGVPFPAAKHRATKYPFEGMEVGDSFFVPGRRNGGFSGSLGYQQLRRGWTFKTRAVDGGVRVWRTA